jgi:hypothetical protein
MRFEVEVNITEKQLLEEIECWSDWSDEAIQKFILKIMPKVADYWTNNVDPKFVLPLVMTLLQRTMKAAKYECGDNAKEMNTQLKKMIEELEQIHEAYYEL